MVDSGDTVATKAQVARCYQVSPTTVQNWARHADWPGLPATREQLDAFLAAIRSPVVRRDGQPTDEGEDPQREYRRHKARLAQLQVLEREGRLVPVEAAEAELREMALAVRKALLAVPRIAAPQLVGLTTAEDVEAILAAEVDKVLLHLSDIEIEEADDA